MNYRTCPNCGVRGMKQYGAYREFDHEPSEAETTEAIHGLAQGLVGAIEKEADIICQAPVDGFPQRWTVGIKISFCKARLPLSGCLEADDKEAVPRQQPGIALTGCVEGNEVW